MLACKDVFIFGNLDCMSNVGRQPGMRIQAGLRERLGAKQSVLLEYVARACT